MCKNGRHLCHSQRSVSTSCSATDPQADTVTYRSHAVLPRFASNLSVERQDCHDSLLLYCFCSCRIVRTVALLWQDWCWSPRAGCYTWRANWGQEQFSERPMQSAADCHPPGRHPPPRPPLQSVGSDGQASQRLTSVKRGGSCSCKEEENHLIKHDITLRKFPALSAVLTNIL